MYQDSTYLKDRSTGRGFNMITACRHFLSQMSIDKKEMNDKGKTETRERGALFFNGSTGWGDFLRNGIKMEFFVNNPQSIVSIFTLTHFAEGFCFFHSSSYL